MKFLNLKAEEEIADYVVATYEKIKVIPGKCRYNYMCQVNSVHDAIENNEKEIAMTVYLNDSTPIIHFLNITKGKYVDNTLGHWSINNEYFLVKKIGKDDFFLVDTIFLKLRNHLRKNVSFLVRLFSDYQS